MERMDDDGETFPGAQDIQSFIEVFPDVVDIFPVGHESHVVLVLALFD
tara:strand:+ start:116 stop:259 length:144 start_codon:yes stop_codon:yes gene_type:complete